MIQNVVKTQIPASTESRKRSEYAGTGSAGCVTGFTKAPEH
jgi:hypothetical protein